MANSTTANKNQGLALRHLVAAQDQGLVRVKGRDLQENEGFWQSLQVKWEVGRFCKHSSSSTTIVDPPAE